MYGYVTDNAGVGECSKMGLFHPYGGGSRHGAEPVILSTSRGCSRPHLSPHPCRVARQATLHRVLACLADGLGIRGTARGFELDPNTVLQWLVEAVEQLQSFSASFLRELHLNQVQLDELYAVLSAVRDAAVSEAEAIERLSRSPRHHGAFRSLGAAFSVTGQRSRAQAALDAAACIALRASGQNRAATADREVKHRVVFGTKAAVA